MKGFSKERTLTFRFLSALLLISVFLSGQGARPAHAANYIVNSLKDNTSDNGSCTLREAILAGNDASDNDDCDAGSSGNDAITFSFGGMVKLTSTLLNIVEAV